MIVYESEGGKIKIADPNYPGKQREAGIDRGNWIPYSSGDKAGNLGVQYPYIYYIAKTAEIPFNEIANRWKETAEKTIGTIEPNTFPKTELFHVSDNTTKALPEVIETMADSVVVVATCPTCVDKYQNDYTPILLTDAQGKFLSWTNGEGKLLIPTKPGTTKFGLAIHGYSEAGKNGLGYIDFKWLTVKRKTYVKATVINGPLDGHFRNDDNGFITYHDAPVELTSVSTGPEAGVYGSFKSRTYTWDTTYTVMGNFTHTQSIRVTLDDSMTTVKDYRISWTRTQAGEWTENTTVTGGDVKRDAASSSDTQDTFVLSGANACTKINSVSNITTRLDRNYKTILESYRCNASSKVRISLGKE